MIRSALSIDLLLRRLIISSSLVLGAVLLRKVVASCAGSFALAVPVQSVDCADSIDDSISLVTPWLRLAMRGLTTQNNLNKGCKYWTTPSTHLDSGSEQRFGCCEWLRLGRGPATQQFRRPAH